MLQTLNPPREVPTDGPAIEAEMEYVCADSQVNRRFVAPGKEFNTCRSENHRVTIRNGRPFRDQLTLDSVGFSLVDHTSAVRDFLDKDEVDRVYPAEVAEAVKAITGADKVFPSGWMVRTSGDEELLATSAGYKGGGGGIQPPGIGAHVDLHWAKAPKMGPAAYRRLCPDGPGLKRWISGSFWRTCSEPPQDWPLAVCDGTSLQDDEGVPNTMVVVDALPDRDIMYGPLAGEDEMMAASIFSYRPEHRWWFFPDMTRDEALFFKFHDSDHSVAWRCPHAAFHDETAVGARTRRSIEFRVIAFFE